MIPIIKLTGNKVLAIRHEKKEKTDGGIIILDIPRTDGSELFDMSEDRATVVAAGKGIRDKKNRLKPTEVKAGDVIIFNKSKCLDVKIEGKTYVMMRESEILGVIEP